MKLLMSIDEQVSKTLNLSTLCFSCTFLEKKWLKNWACHKWPKTSLLTLFCFLPPHWMHHDLSFTMVLEHVQWACSKSWQITSRWCNHTWQLCCHWIWAILLKNTSICHCGATVANCYFLANDRQISHFYVQVHVEKCSTSRLIEKCTSPLTSLTVTWFHNNEAS